MGQGAVATQERRVGLGGDGATPSRHRARTWTATSGPQQSGRTAGDGRKSQTQVSTAMRPPAGTRPQTDPRPTEVAQWPNSTLGSCRQPARHPHPGGVGALGAAAVLRGRTPVVGGLPSGPAGRGTRKGPAHAPGRYRRLGGSAEAGSAGGKPPFYPRLAGPARRRQPPVRVPQTSPTPRRTRGRRTGVAAVRGHAQISAPPPSWSSTRRTRSTSTLTNLGPLCARTSTTDAPFTGTGSSTPSRSSTASRSCRWPCRGIRPRPAHLLLQAARRRHLHVPLPLRGHGARADGHDRDGLRAAPEQNIT